MPMLKRVRLVVMRAAITCLVASLLASVPSSPAQADHRYDTYPGRGYMWFATYDNFASVDVASNNCNPRELEAYDRVLATTYGEFPVRWPSGIRMYRENCTGTGGTGIDIKLSYEPPSNFNNNSYGGWNQNTPAPSSWCAIWGRPHPCGTHPAIVHLNNGRFGNSPYSDHYRRRLIMHETGHSFGLAHHCSANAIMNDGTSGCNGGAWTNINGYQQTDLDGIHGIYPNWKYPS